VELFKFGYINPTRISTMCHIFRYF